MAASSESANQPAQLAIQ